MEREISIREDETLDTLLGERVKVIQKKKGYRFSLDPLLLAGFVSVGSEETVIDIGTGSGVIPLLLAAGSRGKSITGVEFQEELAEMAGRSVEYGGCAERISILHCDLSDLPGRFAPEAFDLVISNPPYRKLGSGRINPDEQKAVARHELAMTLEELVKVSRYLVRPKGRVACIYPVTRLIDLLACLRNYRLEPKQMRLVHPKQGEEANLVLVESRSEGGSELRIHPPLYVYTGEGEYTEEIQRLFIEGYLRDL